MRLGLLWPALQTRACTTATAAITSASSYSGSDTATLKITKAAATVTISGNQPNSRRIPETGNRGDRSCWFDGDNNLYRPRSFAPAAAIVGVEAVEAAAEVLYVAGDTIPEGKAVGDVKTAAVTAVTAVTAVPAVISPSGAGDYTVSVSVVDDNYSGSDSATLTVGSVD